MVSFISSLSLPSFFLPPTSPRRRSQVLKAQTYPVKINDAAYNVTIDEVHILKKGKTNAVIGVKGGYFFLAKADNDKAEQQVPLVAASLGIGFYWAVGPDA